MAWITLLLKTTRRLGPALLALAAGYAASGCGNTHYTEREVEVGHHGVARYNHFLAAARFLEDMGMEAKSVPSIAELPEPPRTLLMLPYAIANSTGMARHLSEWAHQGGHLIVPVGPMPTSSPWYLQDVLAGRGTRLPDDDDDEEGGTPLLDVFGIEEIEPGFFTNGHQVAIHGDLLDVKLKNKTTFKIDRFPSQTYSNGDRWQSSLLSIKHGAGRVTLLAEPDPFTNRYIGDEDHARLLWRLARLGKSDQAVFVYDDGGLSFVGMLLRHGWMPLLSLALLILFWLLRNGPRFGPIKRAEPDASRQFAEHVTASGQYLWSQDKSDELLDPMRRRIHHKLAKRHIGLATDDPLSNEKLAELTGLPPAEVDEAMSAMAVHDGSMFARMVGTLQSLDAKL